MYYFFNQRVIFVTKLIFFKNILEANIISVPVEEYKAQIAFYTLGCKLNFAETSTISRTFDSKKYIQVDFDKYADVYVINTCSVTENADNKFKKLVQKSLMINPQAFIAAIGCFAQLQHDYLAKHHKLMQNYLTMRI